jgi:hypothetical protein
MVKMLRQATQIQMKLVFHFVWGTNLETKSKKVYFFVVVINYQKGEIENSMYGFCNWDNYRTNLYSKCYE